MLTLGIETSCDETSCAVLEEKTKVRSNIISSSLFRHKPFGGVVPEIASRHALEQIDAVLQEALSEAGVRAQELGLIAVTCGPGLIGSLLVGVSFAKALAFQLDIPLVGVNHLEAHLVANFISEKEPERFLGLLVSGGHTSLTLHERGRVTLLGSTVDDAVGEAFDKTAKILGLDYPGGPEIEKKAREGRPGRFKFTKPKQKNPFDFSFSGIKTAVLYEVRKEQSGGKLTAKRGKKDVPSRPLSPEFIRDMARGFQDAATSWLVDKTLAAALENDVETIVAGGGVSANGYLRARLQDAGGRAGRRVLFPERTLALDNAAMIARRGIELFEKGERAADTLTGMPNLKIAS